MFVVVVVVVVVVVEWQVGQSGEWARVASGWDTGAMSMDSGGSRTRGKGSMEFETYQLQ